MEQTKRYDERVRIHLEAGSLALYDYESHKDPDYQLEAEVEYVHALSSFFRWLGQNT